MKYLSIYIVLFFLFLSNSQVFATVENHPVGARSAGMAGASVVLTDVWSVHHNQAGLAFVDRPVLGLYYENRFQIQELSLTSLAGAYPLWNGVAGFNLTYWGYSKFNTTKIGLSFAKKLGEKLSIGAQLDYFNTYLSEEYGNKGAVVAELGLRAEPVQGLYLGAHVYNPTRTRIADYEDERLPTILRTGIGYQFSEKLILSIETEKDLDNPIIFKTGAEYQFAEKFYMRAGVSSDPVFSTFGFKYLLRGLSIDLAFSIHQVLGLAPHFSVDYTF